VHPLLPRFGQAITGVLCLEALALRTWPAVAVALGLVVLDLALPRRSPVALLFGLLARPAATLEPAAPTRFAEQVAALALAAAVGLLAAGLDAAGWSLVGVVAALGLLGAVGLCLACEGYRLLAGRGGTRRDVRAALGLEGGGPWLVLLTAPGCAGSDGVARALEAAADGLTVVRVDLARHPAAGALPIRRLPAALAVGADGRLRATRAGRLADEDVRTVARAV
jgi:hypothetical protein